MSKLSSCLCNFERARTLARFCLVWTILIPSGSPTWVDFEKSKIIKIEHSNLNFLQEKNTLQIL